MVDRGARVGFTLQTSSGVDGLLPNAVQVVRVVTSTAKRFYISMRTTDPSSLDGLLAPSECLPQLTSDTQAPARLHYSYTLCCDLFHSTPE